MTGAAPITCLSSERQRELKAHCVNLLRRAILTLRALPDRDRAYLSTNLRSAMPTPVLGWLAYKTEEFDQARERPRFRPTPRDSDIYLDVLGWLTWLEQQGPNEARDVKIITAWALGMPWRKLAERFGRSEDTMRRWSAGGIHKITGHFWKEIDRLT